MEGSKKTGEAVLKLCPFCMGPAELYGVSPISDRASVSCSMCGVRTSLYKTDREAIEAWNNRSPWVEFMDVDEEFKKRGISQHVGVNSDLTSREDKSK